MTNHNENGFFQTVVKVIDQKFAINNLNDLEFNKEMKKGKRDVQVRPVSDAEFEGLCLTPLQEFPVKLKIVSQAEYQKQLEIVFDFFSRMEQASWTSEEKEIWKKHKYVWLANNEVRQNYICEDDPRLKP